LWRAKLLRLAEREHILVLTMHHIISDGWSTTVLCRECSGELRFSELLERVRKVVLGAYAHQEVPYWLVIKLPMGQGGYQMPERLVDVPYIFFDFNGYTPSRSQVANLTVSPFSTPPTSGDAGVEVRVLEHADTLDLSIKYSPDRIAPVHIARMLEDYQALFEAVVANPDVLISSI